MFKNVGISFLSRRKIFEVVIIYLIFTKVCEVKKKSCRIKELYLKFHCTKFQKSPRNIKKPKMQTGGMLACPRH